MEKHYTIFQYLYYDIHQSIGLEQKLMCQNGEISFPKRPKNGPKIEDKIDDFDKEAIRRIVH